MSSVRPLPLRYIRMSNGKKKDIKHEDMSLKHCPQQQSLLKNGILCEDPEMTGHDEPHRIKLTGRTSDILLLYVFLKHPLPLKKCKVKRTGTSPNVYKNNEPHSRQLRKLHSVNLPPRRFKLRPRSMSVHCALKGLGIEKPPSGTFLITHGHWS